MKRLSLILAVGVIFAAAVIAQNTGREENAGSFFMQPSEASSDYLPVAIDQNPGLSSEGPSNGATYFEPIAQDLGATIFATGLAKPEPHQ